jgi:cell surface protein SprA
MGADTLGNTIQNSRNIQLNGQLNMVTLYNKVPYLKKINQKSSNKNQQNTKTGKSITALKNSAPKNQKDTTKKEKENNYVVLEYLARILMSAKNVTATYSMTNGTILPGYAQSTHLMGMGSNFQGPTAGFIFGSQKDIRDQAIATTEDNNPNNDWLVKTPSVNTPYATTSSNNLNIRANLEPLPDLKIELTATRTEAKNNSEFFRWTLNDTLRDGSVVDHFKGQSPITTGNFSMSYMAFRTSFVKDREKTFQTFLDDRANISARLGAKNPNSNGSINGFADGYNATSQDVLIPAFLAAYAGKNTNNSTLSAFPKIPLPNWRATYDGLSKIEAIKKYFKSFTLSHAYRSTYSVGGYQSNLLFIDEDANGNKDGFTAIKETVSSITGNPNFLSQNAINTITISEQWSPLIKLDMTLNNSILLTFEYKKDRNLSLGLTSRTVTEVVGREIIGGTGYRIKNLSMGKKITIKGKQIKSDLNLKLDLSFRKNETVMRRIVEGVSQSTGGTNIISIKVAADYVISERINIRVFYDRIINKPVISSSFPSTNTNAGVSLRLMLNN